MRSGLLPAAAPLHGAARLRPLRATVARAAPSLPSLAAGVAVTVLIAAVVWGVVQHRAVHTMIVEAETARYIEEFRGGPVADAWQRLSAVWARELPRQNALLERIAQANAPADGFRHFRHFVLDTVREHRMQREIALVDGYFRRLASCVRIGSCDAAAITARFGDLPRRFRNQHFLYLSEAYPGQNLDRTFEVLQSPAS